jgi:thymidylate synthase
MIDNKLDRDYQELLRDILVNGTEKEDRTGTGTISVFGRQIRHNMTDGFPLLTTKKMAVKTMMTELKWFLKGDTNIKYLVDNGCNIWNGDAYKSYEKEFSNPVAIPNHTKLPKEEFIQRIKTDDEFAKKWGELGPIYGKQWRKWKQKDILEWGYKEGEVEIDQIQNLINDLKTNPDSRRLMVNAWNVGELDNMVLPPCHYGFQVYTRKLTTEERIAEFERRGYIKNEDSFELAPTRAISLMWNQRSVDTFLGLPFNIASYGMLLHLIAKECNMVAEELVANLGDVHIYKNHLKAVKTQLSRQPYGLPKLTKLNSNLLEGEFDYTIEYYESHPRIEAPLSN